MSHLTHIVKLKQELIAFGVNDPEKQVDIVQTAYTKALINVNGANKLTAPVCRDFNNYILSYWNEVTPNKGNLIKTQIGHFFVNLDNLFNKTIVDDVSVITIVPRIEDVNDVKYTEFETYKDLVKTLIDEANHKLAKFIETNQIA